MLQSLFKTYSEFYRPDFQLDSQKLERIVFRQQRGRCMLQAATLGTSWYPKKKQLIGMILFHTSQIKTMQKFTR